MTDDTMNLRAFLEKTSAMRLDACDIIRRTARLIRSRGGQQRLMTDYAARSKLASQPTKRFGQKFLGPLPE